VTQEEGLAERKKDTHADALAKFITRPQADLKSAQSVRINKYRKSVKRAARSFANHYQLIV